MLRSLSHTMDQREAVGDTLADTLTEMIRFYRKISKPAIRRVFLCFFALDCMRLEHPSPI
jgi:hypothetical protein